MSEWESQNSQQLSISGWGGVVKVGLVYVTTKENKY